MTVGSRSYTRRHLEHEREDLLGQELPKAGLKDHRQENIFYRALLLRFINNLIFKHHLCSTVATAR